MRKAVEKRAAEKQFPEVRLAFFRA